MWLFRLMASPSRHEKRCASAERPITIAANTANAYIYMCVYIYIYAYICIYLSI